MVRQTTFSDLEDAGRRCMAEKDELLSAMGVGATSEEEYADMAHELYLNKGLCQVKVDKEGITRVYDAARNLFAHTTPTGRQGPTSRPPEARPTSTIRDGPCREHAREET